MIFVVSSFSFLFQSVKVPSQEMDLQISFMYVVGTLLCLKHPSSTDAVISTVLSVRRLRGEACGKKNRLFYRLYSSHLLIMIFVIIIYILYIVTPLSLTFVSKQVAENQATFA